MKKLKELSLPQGVKIIFGALMVFSISLLESLQLAAQSVPDKVEVDINSDGGSTWYGQPWVWAVGVAVFIIIIVAITRNGNKNA